MSAAPPLWLSEADVVSLMTLSEAIAALERGLVLEARGEAHNMVKTHVAWNGDHNLHAIGAAFPSLGFVGTKTWAHTDSGAMPLLILFDAHDGSLKAIIEALALGQLRTGGISGVATRWLARADADELAIVGSGKQALAQVAAVAAVRPLKRVRVFSPNSIHRSRFAADVHHELGLPALTATSVAEAVNDAPIITLVTRAREPFLSAAMLAYGSHVNAVGAITPDRVEFTDDVFARCDAVVADSVPSVQKLSREFVDYFSDGEWRQITPLSTIVAERRARPHDADLTLFKAMGMGVSDLALG
ncbi:MAG TPA: ornithine cyclodeaminase family protein, partial [Candidatus Kryptonia bacterium]|nr:ornithine cyclodeaminase family protein [Candidatus Kryptonia bacterium]